MKDYLVKAIAYDGKIRCYAAVTTNTVEEARKRQDTWPTASSGWQMEERPVWMWCSK